MERGCLDRDYKLYIISIISSLLHTTLQRKNSKRMIWCPRCKRTSLKPFNDREVVGVSKCGKHVLNNYHTGVKCLLCSYHVCKTETK
jgi:hypothetical protein